jgi:cytochrome c-type biogenesis protein CcmH/NrfG
MMLGRSYTVIKDTAGAKRAFGRAMALKPDELAPKQQFIALAWAEADVNGSAPLPEDLMTAARDALRVDPGNAEGLLVEGLAAAKAGDMTGARARWTRAAASASAGGALAAEINRRLGTLP